MIAIARTGVVVKLSVMDIASMWPSPLPTTSVVELWPFGVVHMQCAYVVLRLSGVRIPEEL